MDYTAQNKAVSEGIDAGLTPMEAYNKYQASIKTDITSPTTPVNPVVPVSPVAPTAPKTEEETATDNAKQEMIDSASFYKSQLEKQQTEFANYTKDIEDIDNELSPEIQNVKDIFAKKIADMETTNKAMQGQVGLGNVRSGLSRYAQATASGLVSAETTAGMNRIKELETQKVTAIQAAKNALKSDAKDKWSTFNNYMNQVNEAYENKKKAVLDLAKMYKDEETAAAEKTKAELDTQKYTLENLDNLAATGVELTDEELSKYDSKIGGVGAAKQYYTAAKQKASETNAIDSLTKINKVLETIPEGEQVTIGGKIYTGRKDNENIVKTEYDPKTGISTSLTYDKNGKLISSEQKKVGTPKATTKTSQTTGFNEKTAKTSMESQLKTVVGGDGYISPENYTIARNAWIQNGGNATRFDTLFKGYRNPNNPYYITNKQ